MQRAQDVQTLVVQGEHTRRILLDAGYVAGVASLLQRGGERRELRGTDDARRALERVDADGVVFPVFRVKELLDGGGVLGVRFRKEAQGLEVVREPAAVREAACGVEQLLVLQPVGQGLGWILSLCSCPGCYLLHLFGREVFFQQEFQLVAVDGFRKIVGKAGLDVLLSCAGDGVGRERDDGASLAEVLHLLHALQGLDAVHLGHAVVEENHIVGFFLYHREGNGSG